MASLIEIGNDNDARHDSIGRRTFLRQIELLAGGIACGALPLLASGCAARARYMTPTVLGNRLAVRLSDLATGALLVEDPRADLPIYVRRTTNGYTAVSTRCMHRGCQVEPAAEKLVCPCHGSEYAFAGDVLKGPTERALIQYRVTADADMVYIHVDATEKR